MEFDKVVRKRRMVHTFEQRPVEGELIDHLLDTARRGPSAGFSQGTDFLVLDQPDALTRFWHLTEDPEFPNDPEILAVAPPVIVLAYSDPNRYVGRYSQPDKLPFGLDRAEAWPVKFWDTDTAMACMLLLLAAVNAGLGGLIFGVFFGIDEVRREFGVPDDRNLIQAVALGYAGAEEKPIGSAYSLARRPLQEMVHRNRW